MRPPCSVPLALAATAALAALACGGPDPEAPGEPLSEPTAGGSVSTTDSAAPSPDPATDEAAELERIRGTFFVYRDALLAGDGDAAARVADERIKALYEQLVEAALTMPFEELQAEPPMHGLLVLTLRHRLHRAELEAAQGRAFASLAAREDFVQRDGLDLLGDLPHLRRKGPDAAIASIDAEGNVPALYFVREGGSWRVDLMRLFESVQEATLEEMWTQDPSYTTEQVFYGAFEAMSVLAGEEPPTWPEFQGLLQGPRD